jgi:transposase
VSAGGAEWIHEVVPEKAPQTLICLDAFHVVKWADEALDTVRRRLAADLRAAGKHAQAALSARACEHCVKTPAASAPGSGRAGGINT